MTKLLFLLLVLAALAGLIESKHLSRKLKAKHHPVITPLENLQRKRRDAEESSSSNSSDSGENGDALHSLTRFFMAASWEENKLNILSDFLQDISDINNNVTIIGWQRILDENGNIKNLNTIGLVIPPRPITETTSQNVAEDDDDEEEDWKIIPHDEIKSMREIFSPLAQLGLPASVTHEEFDKEGNEESLLYLDQDELYSRAEGFSIYNRTVRTTPVEVSEFIANLKPGSLGKPAILKYGADGNLDPEHSYIQPYLLGTVLDSYEIPENILNEAPAIIAQISQEYPQNQIPKQLALHFNKEYPKYKWRVIVDPSHYYITRDVSIELAYDNFDLDADSDVSYLVYGSKVSTTSS